MSGYNLPPGCHERHIPGWRPEDVRRDRIADEVFGEWVDDGVPEECCAGCDQGCRKWERFYSGECPEFGREVDERMER